MCAEELFLLAVSIVWAHHSGGYGQIPEYLDKLSHDSASNFVHLKEAVHGRSGTPRGCHGVKTHAAGTPPSVLTARSLPRRAPSVYIIAQEEKLVIAFITVVGQVPLYAQDVLLHVTELTMHIPN